MLFTKKDSAAAYARACRKWYGPRAEFVVKSQIKRLELKGDLAWRWQLVAEALSQSDSSSDIKG